jgi:hypothetical protein
VKALEASLADKAERCEILTSISSLQAAVGQKVDRAESEAALARKLDVRTFLASQSCVPARDSLSLGTACSGGAAIPHLGAHRGEGCSAPHYSPTTHATNAAAFVRTTGSTKPIGESTTESCSKAFEFATPTSAHAGGRTVNASHFCEETNINYPAAILQHPHGVTNTPSLTTYGIGGSGSLNTRVAYTGGNSSRHNITPVIGPVRPMLRSGSEALFSCAAGTLHGNTGTVGPRLTEPEGSALHRPPLAQMPTRVGGNTFTGAGMDGAHVLNEGGPHSSALNPGQAARKGLEQPGTPSATAHVHTSYSMHETLPSCQVSFHHSDRG